MCSTCGCDSNESVKVTLLDDDHLKAEDHQNDEFHHHHPHDHQNHVHSHAHIEVEMERDVLYKNNLVAERIRGYLDAKDVLAINLVSAPGSGKTTLLEKVIGNLKDEIEVAVIEGDQQTANDATRIHATGVKVVQVNTGSGCHLDAEMVQNAIKKLELSNHSLLLIENVGNLVCPALFDLGEAKRVVIVSVTEGEDKPLKYPNMFATSDLCIINKTDLLPYVNFDVGRTKEYALRVNHHLEIIETSATQDKGLTALVDWIKEQMTVSA